MSGGSYNYLYLQRDTRGHVDMEDLARMRDRLNRVYPASAAARDTSRLYELLNRGQNDALAEVWHAVEWADSCDWMEEDVREVVEKYQHHGDADPEDLVLADIAKQLRTVVERLEGQAGVVTTDGA